MQLSKLLNFVLVFPALLSFDANGRCAGSLQYTLVQQVHLSLFMANGQFEIRLDESPQMVTGFMFPELQLVAF
jgi:hypothetical protein